MKTKFKVGDKVLIKTGWEKGSIGVVTKLHKTLSRILYEVYIEKPGQYKTSRSYFSYDLEPYRRHSVKETSKKEGPEQYMFEQGDKVALSEAAKQYLKEHDPLHQYVLNPEGTFTIWVRFRHGSRPAYALHEVKDFYGRTYYFFNEDLKKAAITNPTHCFNKRDYLVRLQRDWKDICGRYLKEFCDKHEFVYDPMDWVGNDPGTIIEICDMFVSMENIRFDIDNEIPKGKFETWYWKQLELAKLGVEHWMNFPSYCKGAPDEWTRERMQNLREAHQRVQDAQKALDEAINAAIDTKS